MADQKAKSKIRTQIMLIILIGLLVIAYKVMYMPDQEEALLIDENVTASQRMESLLDQIEVVSFDMDIIINEKFESLKSIATPLISIPVGRDNPFSNF
ncbi:MAG: hypothetical protein JW740_00270 [Candidatus Zambryskibacteria bacterium]|nr:hypothetical protein [Candidatus Zambryskibacteria bacterium]